MLGGANGEAIGLPTDVHLIFNLLSKRKQQQYVGTVLASSREYLSTKCSLGCSSIDIES